MARSRRKERKRNSPSDESDTENQKASTSRYRKRTSKVTKKRCKSIPETSNPRKRRARGPNKLRGTSSVELVSEIPCCASEEDRRKYAKLGLHSALFLTDSRPAKRTQSHISVITISSSDEDIGMERTAEWVATSDPEGHLCEEESFMVGESGDLHDVDKSPDVVEPTISGEQTSVPETPSPERAFRPLCVSTPELVPAEEELTELSRKLETTFPHPHASCLTSPINVYSNMTPSKNMKGPHTVLSSDPASSQQEHSQMKSSQKFYFGPFQTSKEIQVSSLSDSSTSSAFSLRPKISDMALSGIQPISGELPGLYVVDGSLGAESAQRRHVRQIPSTSRSPVSDPIYVTETSDVPFEDEESRPQ